MAYRGSSEKRNFFARLTTGANSAPLQDGGNFVREFGTKNENQPSGFGSFGGAQSTQNTQSFGGPNANAGSGQSSARGFSFGGNSAGGQQQTSLFNNQPSTDQPKAQEFGSNVQQQTGGEKKEGTDFSGRPDRFTRIGYVPKDRKLDEIQKEDDLAKELYSMVFETDKNILVTGAGNNINVINSWNQLGLDASIMENINRSGYVHPRKIQAYAIPLIIEGYDLKAQAETGSGKSAAFLIPLINKIIDDKKRNPISGVNNKPFAIIMEPTRELALQLYDQARKIAFNTGVRVVKAYGQYQVTANGKEIMDGSDIVIGTPGRLGQFVGDGTIDVSMMKYLVLDEADRLISDADFIEIVQKIRGLSTYPKKENVQNLLFSATFPEEVEALANDLLKSKRAFVHNELTIAVNSKITQEFIECPENEKKVKVLGLLKNDLKNAQAINVNAKQPRTLIFVKKRSDADLVCLFLCDSGIRATTINGDRPQKERELALEYFRSNETPVLVATDVCARGLDIKDLDWVINMDLPDKIETYVHRIGRTGRLKAGRALSFFNELTDHSLASSLVKLLEESNSPNIPAFLRDSKTSQAPPASNFSKSSPANDFSPQGFGDQQMDYQNNQQQPGGFEQGFGGQQKFGNYDVQQQSGGFEQGFGGQQKFCNYDVQQQSGGFEQVKSGEFGSGFGGQQQSGGSSGFASGFGGQQQSGGSSGFGAQQKSGGFNNKASGSWSGFGSAR